MPDRVPAQTIIEAYQQTGSIWEAGKLLGIPGQTVHHKLRAVGYPMAKRNWTSAEEAELRSLVGHMTLSEIGDRLGRPYAGVACKVSGLGIGTRFGNRQPVKIPRGAGYDKASVTRYAKEIERSGTTVHKFARGNGLGVEMLCQALERHLPEWWEAYRRAHSDLPETECPYCHRIFVPSNRKQQYCSRKCGSDAREDDRYFGGKRRETIGLAEGQCQLCLRTNVKGLSSHHLVGKDNDPDNGLLVALCPGCHQIVGVLAGRSFLAENEGWEHLIGFVMMRMWGAETVPGIYSFVEIERMTDEEVEDMDEEVSA